MSLFRNIYGTAQSVSQGNIMFKYLFTPYFTVILLLTSLKED